MQLYHYRAGASLYIPQLTRLKQNKDEHNCTLHYKSMLLKTKQKNTYTLLTIIIALYCTLEPATNFRFEKDITPKGSQHFYNYDIWVTLWQTKL